MSTRILAIALAAVLLLNLCSCGSIPDSKPETTDTAAAATSEDDTKQTASQTSLASEETPEPAEEVDIQKIAEAYHSGESDELNEKEAAVLEAVTKAVSEFYSEEMSEEETVIAAHDWLTTHTTYDEDMMLAIPKQSPDSDNPYGALIKNCAICRGYTTSFQLLMDILGIETITVSGEADDEEHAWNMVHIDGNWYHVDTTWDDFVPDEENRPPFHLYCLVPDYVMEVHHVWDRDSSPAADSEDKIYYMTHGLFAESTKDSMEYLDNAFEAGLKHCEIMSADDSALCFLHTQSYWVSDMGRYVVTVYWF